MRAKNSHHVCLKELHISKEDRSPSVTYTWGKGFNIGTLDDMEEKYRRNNPFSYNIPAPQEQTDRKGGIQVVLTPYTKFNTHTVLSLCLYKFICNLLRAKKNKNWTNDFHPADILLGFFFRFFRGWHINIPLSWYKRKQNQNHHCLFPHHQIHSLTGNKKINTSLERQIILLYIELTRRHAKCRVLFAWNISQLSLLPLSPIKRFKLFHNHKKVWFVLFVFIYRNIIDLIPTKPFKLCWKEDKGIITSLPYSWSSPLSLPSFVLSQWIVLAKYQFHWRKYISQTCFIKLNSSWIHAFFQQRQNDCLSCCPGHDLFVSWMKEFGQKIQTLL